MESALENSLTTTRHRALPQQRNPCTDCKSAQQCTTRGHALPDPSYIRVGVIVWACGCGQTDRHTDTHTQTCMSTIHFASSTTHKKCNDQFTKKPRVIIIITGTISTNVRQSKWNSKKVKYSANKLCNNDKLIGLLRTISVSWYQATVLHSCYH